MRQSLPYIHAIRDRIVQDGLRHLYALRDGLPLPFTQAMAQPRALMRVPQQVVIQDAGFVCPDFSVRAWPLHLWATDGGIVTYEQLAARQRFQGTDGVRDDALLLVEVWRNVGSNGHTEHTLSGWAVLTGKQAAKCRSPGCIERLLLAYAHGPAERHPPRRIGGGALAMARAPGMGLRAGRARRRPPPAPRRSRTVNATRIRLRRRLLSHHPTDDFPVRIGYGPPTFPFWNSTVCPTTS